MKHPLAALAAASLLALSACGGDDGSDGDGSGSASPRAVKLELTGSGEKTTMKVPKSVEGGVVRLEFTNSTAKKESEAQLVRFDDGHTAEEALRAAESWGEKGSKLPDWVELAGGVGSVPPGETGSATQELEPGSYMAVSISTNAMTDFEVTSGDSGEELPESAARIDESEYSFETSGLKPGKAQVLVENKGREPHFVVAAKMRPGKTVADVRKFVRTEKGEPPVDFEETWDTSLMEGGGKQVVELELDAGKYALFCWVPDRAGGPPHAVKGMISEAVVG